MSFSMPVLTISVIFLLAANHVCSEDEDNDDEPPVEKTMVIYGKFCAHVEDFNVDGTPEKEKNLFDIKVFEIPGSSSTNTLHIVVKTSKTRYDFLDMMAIDERGMPSGHFHHYPCADAKKHPTTGTNKNRILCTPQEGGKFGKKYGKTEMSFTMKKKDEKDKDRDLEESLGTVSNFWTWSPENGPAPRKIQFRYAAIKATENDRDTFWVDMLSPVFDFQEKIAPKRFSIGGEDKEFQEMSCFRDEVTQTSKRNFKISDDQTELAVNDDYMRDLFPDLIFPTRPTTTTALTSTATTTTTTVQTKQPTTTELTTTEEDEGPPVEKTMVIFGKFCAHVEDFDVDGTPEKEKNLFDIKVFEIPGSSSTNTLHIVVKTSKTRYDFLDMMAIDERGMPSGHFHHYPCADAKKHPTTGTNKNRILCTPQEGGKFGKKYGKTEMSFTMKKKDEKDKDRDLEESLGTVSNFWTWSPENGPAPRKIQFRYAAIKATENDRDTFWVDMLSPVFDFQEKIAPKRFSIGGEDKEFQEMSCFRDEVTQTSKRNFKISDDQTELAVNDDYMRDLFPDLIFPTRPTTTTALTSTATTTTTTVQTKQPTTTELTTTEEDEGPPVEKTMVIFGKFCAHVEDFDVDGTPEKEKNLFDIKVFEIPGSSSTNTLHIVVKTSKTRYDFLDMMAIDERGMPSGHFHHYPCADAKKHPTTGTNKNRILCTPQEGGKFGKKYGKTEMSFTMKKKDEKDKDRDLEESLGTVSNFWTWSPENGPAPRKIQFRYAAIKATENDRDTFWVDMLSPVFDFQEKIAPKRFSIGGEDKEFQEMSCFRDEVTQTSKRNFKISDDQTELAVNDDYMRDLFPDLIFPTRPTTASTTETTKAIEITSTVSTESEPSTIETTAVVATTTEATELEPFTTKTTAEEATRTAEATELEPSTTETAVEATTTEASKPESSTPETTAVETIITESSKPESSTPETTSVETIITEALKPEPSTPETTVVETITSEVSKPEPSTTEIIVGEAATTDDGPFSHSKPGLRRLSLRPGEDLDYPEKDLTEPITATTAQLATVIPHKTELTTKETATSTQPYEITGTSVSKDIVAKTTISTTRKDLEANIYAVNTVPTTPLTSMMVASIHSSATTISMLTSIPQIVTSPVAVTKRTQSSFRWGSTPSVTSTSVATTSKNNNKPERMKNPHESSKKRAKVADRLRESNGSLSEKLYLKRPWKLNDKPTLEDLYSGCYEEKACVEDVPGCVKSQRCEVLVTYTNYSDAGPGYYRYELLAELSQGHGYVAVGLSSDRQMGHDSVVECVAEESGQVGIFLSWNTKSYENKRMQGNPCKLQSRGPLSGCNVTIQDGKIMCNFYRRAVTKIHTRVFDLNRNNYFILRAFGKGTEPANTYPQMTNIANQNRSKRSASRTKKYGNIRMHKKKYSTASAVSLLDIDETEYDPSDLLFLKIHGVFMIIGWIAILPNVTFVARYFKETWTDVEFFDKPYWLTIHVIGTCTAGIFIFIGFLSILGHSFIVKNQVEFFLEERLHIILGSVVLFLFIVQILMGFFRPNGDRSRKILNIIHFLNGTVSYLLAVVIIFLAPRMETSYFSCSSYLLVIVWLIWSLLWHVVISVQIMRKDRELHFQHRAFLPLPMPLRRSDDMPGQKCRLDVFAFHAAGASIVSLLLILPYLISESGCGCKQRICLTQLSK